MNPSALPPSLEPPADGLPPAEAVVRPPGDADGARRFSKVLITGLGRSGTTAVASILQQCGFYVGSNKTWGVLESPELRQRLLDGDFDGVVAELDRWHAEHGRIAWKEPKLFAGPPARLLPQLSDDWLVIAVFRDPVPVALRRAKSDGGQFLQVMERTSTLQSRLAEFVAGVGKPTLLVSYERLMTSPKLVIEEIARHLDPGERGLPTADEIWDRLMEHRQSYREIDLKLRSYKEIASAAASGLQRSRTRLASFDAASLRHLNAMLPWSTAVALAPDAVLGTGVAESGRPRTVADLAEEAAALNRVLPLTASSTLVLRCGEGLLAMALAAYGGEVWAADAHVEQVVKAQLRVWMAGLERQVNVQLIDTDRPGWRSQMKALGHAEPFDLVVHADALHRLPDPVAELHSCGLLARRHLYLRTWVPDDGLANAIRNHASGDYVVYENLPARAGFDHLVAPALPLRALTRRGLESALMSAGFNLFEVLSMRRQGQGQWVELLATRKGKPA